jgi:hypothetical protein
MQVRLDADLFLTSEQGDQRRCCASAKFLCFVSGGGRWDGESLFYAVNQ